MMSPNTERAQPTPARGRDVALWLGILAGPLAWAVDLELSYALVPLARAARDKLLLYLITLATLAVAAGSGALSFGLLRRLRRDGGEHRERARFMAIAGVVLSGFFAMVILGATIAKIIHGLGD